DYLLTTNDQSLNIVLLTMLDSGRNFIQDDKLIKQNFFKI
ncbi:transcriptional regulator, partial [Acinetobacter baumannii]